MEPSGRGAGADTEIRLGYYAPVASGPGPIITVTEDLDPVAGFGAWWSEGNSNIHRDPGSLGAITKGGVHDLTEIPDDCHLPAGMPARRMPGSGSRSSGPRSPSTGCGWSPAT